MSRRQEKVARAKGQQENYLMGQAAYQGLRILIMLQRAFEDGLHLYNTNKDKMSPEEVEEVERMKNEQEGQLNQLKEQLGLPLDWHYSMLEGDIGELTDTPAEA